LISFGIIKRSEFYEHQITAKQFFSPILAGLIVLKNGLVGFTLIILLTLILIWVELAVGILYVEIPTNYLSSYIFA